MAYGKDSVTANNIAELIIFIDNRPAVVVFQNLQNAFELAGPLVILSLLISKGVKVDCYVG